MSRTSSQAVGAAKAQHLREWVDVTPLREIPRNSAGRSSKVAICLVLGISKSTIKTNSQIRKIFEELDFSLLRVPREKAAASKVLVSELPQPAEFIQLLERLDITRAALARLSHLSNTGQWILEL